MKITNKKQANFFIGRDQDGNEYIVPLLFEKFFNEIVSMGGNPVGLKTILDHQRVYFNDYHVE